MTPTILIALLSLALLISFLVNLSQMQANKHLLEDWAAEKVKRHAAELSAYRFAGAARNEVLDTLARRNESLENTEKQTPRAGTARYDPDDNPPLESRFEAKLRKSK